MPFLENHVDGLMDGAVRKRIFPGAVLTVTRAEQVLLQKAYGVADLFSGRPATLDTFFDLASLTKPLVTVLAVMALVHQGRVGLDQRCAGICHQLKATDKADITLRQLLNHSAGFPPWRPYFMKLRHLAHSERKQALRGLLIDEPLLWPPGSRSDYSDLGYMMLQWVVEEVCGTGLDRFVHQAVFRPLGIEDLLFNSTRSGIDGQRRYAATELCPWRSRLLVGQVDDDNAYAMGGVGGHAGLFGTAGAVTKLLRALLRADQDGDGLGTLDPLLVRAFFKAHGDERWALGFDTPSRHESSAGRHFPRESVGHLGFTGTSFWMHRQKRMIVVLLTNRVHPWRFNGGIKAFRPRLHDAIMEAL